MSINQLKQNRLRLSILFFILMIFYSDLWAQTQHQGWYGGVTFDRDQDVTTWTAGLVYSNMNSNVYANVDSSSPDIKWHSDSGLSVISGYEWQSNSLSYGVEMRLKNLSQNIQEFGIVGFQQSAVAGTNTTIQLGRKIDLLGHLGEQMNDRLKLYGLGGLTLLQVTSSATCNSNNSSDPVCMNGNLGFQSIQNSSNLLGFSLGAGVDYEVEKNWSVRFELKQDVYPHKFYNSQFNDTGNSSTNTNFSYFLGCRIQTFSTGLIYHFD